MSENNEFLTDSHCHLDDEKWGGDIEPILLRAKEAGVGRIITVATRQGEEGALQTLKICKEHDWIRGVVGIHPHDAKIMTDEILAKLENIASSPEIVAVGETGLDFHYNYSPPEKQEPAFREMIRMARRLGKPLVIHSRESATRTLEILDEEKAWEAGGVMHCFSYDAQVARYIISKGFYVSFTGVITYPQAVKTREILASLPTEKILIETDAPYLAPVPYRGKRNEPSYVAIVAKAFAEIRKLSERDIMRITTTNATRLFRLPMSLNSQVAYVIRNNLYLNITNRCTLSCKFCPKRKDWMVKGHYLKLEGEPSFERVMEEVQKFDLSSFKEVVFCGFGEPTLRLQFLIEIAKKLREMSAKSIRLDTDGLANLVYGRDVTGEIAEVIDEVSVSLNAPDAKTYNSICPSRYGESAYEEVKNFILLSKEKFKRVTATVVGMPDIDVEKCRKIVQEMGVEFRVREYNEVG